VTRSFIQRHQAVHQIGEALSIAAAQAKPNRSPPPPLWLSSLAAI